jgi:2',3'-cyclic-nucleotide 2'-phosphodiesterase (5'-nucleotidase family)
MRTKIYRCAFLISLLLLLSCGTQRIVDYDHGGVSIDSTLGGGGLDSLISPYRSAMEEEMNVVIGEATIGLENGKPESALGNFASEATYEAGFKYGNQHDEIGEEAMINSFAMLNTGGLRAPVNKGKVTVGNIYELMPFDNMIVLVKISAEKARELARYLYEKNGQPIFNASFVLSADNEQMKIAGQDYEFNEDIVVITTDYLAGGGDNMTFFEDPLGYWDTGMFLRDVLINYVKDKKKLGGYDMTGKIQINK